MIGILIFIIFAVAGYNNYVKSSASHPLVKTLHFVILFVLFMSFFGNLKILLWDLIKEGTDSLLIINDQEIYPTRLDLYGSIVILLISFYASGLFLKVLAQGKGRMTLLYSMPIFAITFSVDIHKSLILDYSLEVDAVSIFWFVLLISIVLFGLICWFYMTKQAKRLFSNKQS